MFDLFIKKCYSQGIIFIENIFFNLCLPQNCYCGEVETSCIYKLNMTLIICHQFVNKYDKIF